MPSVAAPCDVVKRLVIPRDQDNVVASIEGKEVRLTNLRKIFWPELGLTKGDLLQYYADVAAVLLPHIRDRAMVMKRYPHGAAGDFFFMKRAPTPRPPWIAICTIPHGEDNIIDFPMIQDRAALMWVINLGCIDLNQWYATCDDIDRPDYRALRSGSRRGGHVRSRPRDGDGGARGARHAEDAVGREDHRLQRTARLCAHRPRSGSETGVDLRQGAGAGAGVAKSGADDRRVPRREAPERARARRLQPESVGQHAGVRVSVRPRPEATVSMPVTWKEVERGIRIEDFTVRNVPARVAKLGDLWKPLLASRGRFDLSTFV